MSRTARKDVFDGSEIQIAHLWNRVVRRCFLLGEDPITKKNFDHRKEWIVDLLKHFGGCFGIDLLEYSLLSNHFHLILRSRPDVVATWSDQEIATRWLLICPQRTRADGSAAIPSDAEIKTILRRPAFVKEIRSRLCSFSWWMRLLCQRIAQRANAEDGESGKFWQARFKASLICDEASLLACATYVNLNPIRAALVQKLEDYQYSSIQLRMLARKQIAEAKRRGEEIAVKELPDRHLSPLFLDEQHGPLGPLPSSSKFRCSEKGFLPLREEDYFQLVDWTARQPRPDKAGSTPETVPPVLERLSLKPEVWQELTTHFSKLYFNVAGRPSVVAEQRHRTSGKKFRCTRRLRELMS